MRTPEEVRRELDAGRNINVLKPAARAPADRSKQITAYI